MQPENRIWNNRRHKSSKKKGFEAEITTNKFLPAIFQLKIKPREFPKVSIIIPSKNSLDLLQNCITSLRSHTNYPNYEVIVVDNQSDDKNYLEYLDKECADQSLRVIKYEKTFNHSEMNNTAVELIDSPYAVFMNNDIEILTDAWLEQMIGTAQLDAAIACVGCLLLYPDGTVQHSGIILGINGMAGHAHKFMKQKSAGYHGRLFALQEYIGTTAAFSLIRTEIFKK